jgi:hypothetical protein
MTDIEQCKRHGLPADWCGHCNAALEERERIIALAENKVCFDNRHKGECDHSICYGMIDLIALIKGKD